MKKICVSVLLFSAQLISMNRPPTPDELQIAEKALAKENILFDSKSMRAVKKPLVELLDVDKGNTRYLIDLRAQAVVNQYVIAQRPATC